MSFSHMAIEVMFYSQLRAICHYVLEE